MWEGIKKTLGDAKDLKSAFVSEKKTILQKLRAHQWTSAAELEEFLAKLGEAELTLDEVLWMLLDNDRLRQFALGVIPKIPDQERNNKLIQFSKGKPEKARQFLLQILVQLNAANLARLLRIYANQKDEYVRTVSLDLLPKIDQEHGLPIGFQLLRDEVPALRSRALTYLVATGQPQALFSCASLFHDPEEEIRHKAVQIFTTHRDERTVPTLLKMVRAEMGRVQETAIQALVNQVKDDPEKYDKEIIQLLSDSSPIVRRVPAQFLAQSDPKKAMRKFLLMFRESFGWIRERALRSLKEASGQFVEGIVALMEDPDPEIRGLAETIGVGLEDPRAVPALIRMLKSGDWWYRYSAAETLARIKDPRALQPLVEMLNSEENRLFAIEALGILKDPKALQPLTKLIPSAHQEELLEIIEAFRRIGHPGVAPYLKMLVEKGSEYVRTKASSALEEISGTSVKQETQAAEAKVDGVDLKSVAAPKVNHFLQNAISMGASDFHMAVGNRPTVRIHGRLVPMDYPIISPTESQRMLVEILSEAHLNDLSTKKNVDFCYKSPGLGRFRTNVFVQRHGMDAAFRIIPRKIPTWEQVGLPVELKDLIHHHQGMVLVTGPSGCGKTTTLAAFVDLINETMSSHVITIEDPIEYVHSNKASLVNQREVNSHTKSFFSALRSALREDPDVILVGEMRDLETTRMAVVAAETGHLVLSTLHTTSAAGSIDRIVGSFPPEEHSQMRTMLSESLKAIISQVLLPTPDRTELIPAFEILIVNQAIASLIREGKTFQIPSAQQTGAALGMCLLDQSLLKLVQEKKVDPQAAFARAYKKELIEPFLPNHEQ